MHLTVRNNLYCVIFAIAFKVYLHCYYGLTDNSSQIIHTLENIGHDSRFKIQNS